MQEEKSLAKIVKEGFRIFFPTNDTVVGSKGGPGVSDSRLLDFTSTRSRDYLGASAYS